MPGFADFGRKFLHVHVKETSEMSCQIRSHAMEVSGLCLLH